jgi:hypothetical protein
MTEKEIYHKLEKHYKNILFCRIESPLMLSGIPDIYYIFKDGTKHGWIELKIGKLYKTGIVRIDYRPGQINFLKRHVDKGLSAYVLVYIPINTKTGIYYLSQKFKPLYMEKRLFEKDCVSISNDIGLLLRS